MSEIEYRSLILEISKKLDELNKLGDILCLCEGKIASGSEDGIQNAWSLFKKLEEQNNLGADRLEDLKELLKGVGEWSLSEKVEKFERKRREYIRLLKQIILALESEPNDVERLVAICRGNITEESEGRIQDVRSLFKELENQGILGIHRLGILKEILTETENHDLLKEVEEFEERRKQEDELKRKEDDAKRRKGIFSFNSFIQAVTGKG